MHITLLEKREKFVFYVLDANYLFEQNNEIYYNYH
jgi:hypothetical protein